MTERGNPISLLNCKRGGLDGTIQLKYLGCDIEGLFGRDDVGPARPTGTVASNNDYRDFRIYRSLSEQRYGRIRARWIALCKLISRLSPK